MANKTAERIAVWIVRNAALLADPAVTYKITFSVGRAGKDIQGVISRHETLT